MPSKVGVVGFRRDRKEARSLACLGTRFTLLGDRRIGGIHAAVAGDTPVKMG